MMGQRENYTRMLRSEKIKGWVIDGSGRPHAGPLLRHEATGIRAKVMYKDVSESRPPGIKNASWYGHSRFDTFGRGDPPKNPNEHPVEGEPFYVPHQVAYLKPGEKWKRLPHELPQKKWLSFALRLVLAHVMGTETPHFNGRLGLLFEEDDE